MRDPLLLFKKLTHSRFMVKSYRRRSVCIMYVYRVFMSQRSGVFADFVDENPDHKCRSGKSYNSIEIGDIVTACCLKEG